MKIKLILANIMMAGIMLPSITLAAPTPASQDWVKTWVSANFTPITITPSINWSSLCTTGQSLTDSTGCSPNCNSGSATSTCNTIFNRGQVEQLSGISLPYLNSGVVVFKLTQTGSSGSGASFNVILQQQPTGYGYMCEILNADATPAVLWDASTASSFPTSIITMDSNISAPPYLSDNFVTTIAGSQGQTKYWYNNLSNPLYMLCLGYQVTNGNNLQSNAACGGTTGATCVSYSLA